MASRNKKYIINLFFLFAFFLSAENVFAACASPTANAGARQYFTVEQKYKYCDGTTWHVMQDGGLQLLATISGTAHANFSTATTAIVSGSYAYTAGTGKFTIIDVTDTADPHFVKMLSVSTIGASMAIKGNYAYVAMTSNAGIHVIDFTDKNNPAIVYSFTDVANLQYITEIIARGNYLYVLATNKLTIVDITTPTAPVVVGSYTNATTLAGGNSLDYSNDYVVVASMTYDGISIIDVSNKAAPTQVGSLTDVTKMDMAADVKINGNYAYVGSFALDSIAVVDITNKAAPVITTSLTSSTYFDNLRTMEIKDNLLFVGAQPTGTNPTLSTVDISLPASPVILSGNNPGPGRQHHPYSFSISGNKFIALSNLGGRHMLIYDLTPVQTYQSQASMFMQGPIRQNAEIAAFGNIAVHLSTDENIQVFDITSATSMVARGGLYIPTGSSRFANSLSFDGNYAYSGHSNDSRIVISDIATNVNKPTFVSSLTLAGQPQGLDISGNYLYVAGSNGLTIVDVTTKSNPTVVGNVALGGTARDVKVVGNYAYVVVPTLDKLSVVNVTTKSAPVVSIEVTDATNTDYPRSIDLYGNYAYILSGPDFGSGRITTYNISNPVSPTFSATLTHANFGNPSRIDINPAGTDLYLLGYNLSHISLAVPATPSYLGTFSDADGDHTGGVAAVSGAVLIGSVQDDYSMQAFSAAANPALVQKHYGPGYISLTTAGITASGTYAYVSSVSSVTSVNIADPNNPAVASSITDSVKLQSVQKSTVSGNRVFAVGNNYITTVSISNPASLTILGHLTDAVNLASAKTVKVVGNYAFVGGNKLSVLDISGVNPVHVTSLTHASLSNCGAMEISGSNLYLLCTSTNTFFIIDISTPTAPTIVNAYTNSTFATAANSMVIGDDAAFIAKTSPIIVNLKNPLSLSVHTSFSSSCTMFAKTSSPKRVICRSGTVVRTFDVTDIYDVVLVSTVLADGTFIDGLVHGNLLLSATDGGINIGNLSTISALGTPTRFGGDVVLNLARGIDVANDKAYVSTGNGYINVYDVSNLASATLISAKYLGDYNFYNVSNNISNLYLTGNYAHITGGAQRGNIVIDITDSTNPTKISQYTHPTLGWQNWSTKYYNGHGYSGSTAAGFGSFDVTSATTGVQKGFLTHANINTPYGIDFSGNYAFICSSGTNGLTAVNIANPAAPTYTSTIVDATKFAGCRSVIVSGSYAYVVGITSGYFTAVDISNPAAMTIAGSIVSSTVFGSASNDLAISGTTVFHSNTSRLSSIDISSPASPTLLETFTYGTNPNSYFMKMYGDKLFVANTSTPNISVYSIKSPTALGACSTPGLVDFDNTINAWKYCNGTNFYAFTANGAGGAGCSSPTGKKGELEYNAAEMNYKYCDGTNWKQIGPSTN